MSLTHDYTTSAAMTGKIKFTAMKLAVDDFTSGSIIMHARRAFPTDIFSAAHCFSDPDPVYRLEPRTAAVPG